MDFDLTHHYLPKISPLSISRGTIAGQDTLFLRINKGGVSGLGETVITKGLNMAISCLHTFLSQHNSYSPELTHQQVKQFGLHAREIALIGLALWDLLTKSSNKPLYEILGLPYQSTQTSITISIGEPEWVYQRTKHINLN